MGRHYSDLQEFRSFEAIGLACHHFAQTDLPKHSHCHNEIELNYVESGSLIYLHGGENIALSAGQLGVFWAVIPHRLIEVERSVAFYWVTIPLAWYLKWELPLAFKQRILAGKMIVNRTPPPTDLARFITWHVDLEARAPGVERIVLLELEAYLYRQAISAETAAASDTESVTVSNSAQFHVAQSIVRFMIEHYNNPFSVGEMARQLNIHPSYASRLFHQIFGTNITSYLTQYRLAAAQRLLVTTDASVTDIAMEAGFGSLSRFYASFKRLYGISPREYRALNTKGS